MSRKKEMGVQYKIPEAIATKSYVLLGKNSAVLC